MTKKVLSFFYYLSSFVCLFVLLSGLRVRFPSAYPRNCMLNNTPSDTYTTLMLCTYRRIVAKSLTVLHRIFNVKWNHTRLWSSDKSVWVCGCANSVCTDIFKGQHRTTTIPHFSSAEHVRNPLIVNYISYRVFAFWKRK